MITWTKAEGRDTARPVACFFATEPATRDLERQFLVSGDALERLADLEGFAREDLGSQRLRGRAAAMRIYAVTAKPSTNDQKTI